MNTNIEVRVSFSISQHKRNASLLRHVRAFFGVGAVRYSAGDRTYKYETRALGDICATIIPHFKQYPLCGVKQNDFALFVEICNLMRANLHKHVPHLKKIIDMAYQMNKSGTRRYSKEALLRIIRE